MNFISLQHTYFHIVSVLPIIKMYTKKCVQNIAEPSNVIYKHISTNRNSNINRNRNSNRNNKICSNCIYYKDAVITEESICLKFGKPKIDIKNNINFYYAKDCRNDETKCGNTALYYISKLLK